MKFMWFNYDHGHSSDFTKQPTKVVCVKLVVKYSKAHETLI